MKKVTMYQYSRCGTCRAALKALKQNGYEIESVEITDHPPDPDTLADLVRKSGLELSKFFNTSGQVYKEMKLKDQLKSLSAEEQIALLSSNGKLIKRPIITDGNQVTVGFKEDQFKTVWS